MGLFLLMKLIFVILLFKLKIFLVISKKLNTLPLATNQNVIASIEDGSVQMNIQ